MAIFDDFSDMPPFVRDDDEGLFSRDINGQLVRLDAPTESDYTRQVSLEIDGRRVIVPLAEPLKDAQGNIILDLDGRTTPRYTTIYDAAVSAYEDYTRERAQAHQPDRPDKRSAARPGDVSAQRASGPEWQEFPIPVLCHQPHMNPVAVCRLCMVQIYGQKRGTRMPERKLLPACQHHVNDGMEVFTMNAPGPDGERVRLAVRVMTELLTADHLKPAVAPAPAQELEPFNELKHVADRCGLQGSRFMLDVLATPASTRPPLDDSSPVFIVDHSACILCDRCSRACDEVKRNHIIGRSGKGATTRIGFDLDVSMNDSACVQCGECMVSCPTSAITFKPLARIRPSAGAHRAEVLSAAELAQDSLFDGVPPKFLLWQEGLVVRRRVEKGEVLCRQGQPGNTAFVIKSGQLEVTAWAQDAQGSARDGILGLLKRREPPRKALARFPRGPDDLIVGEMACLSGTPRNADIVALEASEVWEVRRNVLDRIMRAPRQRARFEALYRERALELVLGDAELFRGLPPHEYLQCVDFLKPRLSFVRVTPEQIIFRQGDQADNLYLIRLGHVRVGVSQFEREVSAFYRGPGTLVGEIGLLALSAEDAGKKVDDVDLALSDALLNCGPDAVSAALPAGRRTATCSALDHVEMVRIRRVDFLDMVRTFPLVRQRLVRLALDRINESARADTDAVGGATRHEYLEQGLYQGQSLLLIDMERCTGCDECTRACIQQHGTESHGQPITRLLREGLRFSNYLVTTSCRSCKDAYCMIGCPVDAIHRGTHLQVIIEDHCIGCGLCATNCPYGNIFMIGNERHRVERPDEDHPGRTKLVAQPKAATCDLCDAGGRLKTPMPRCVYACPHDAAIRMTGEQLLKEVTAKAAQQRAGGPDAR